jgi:Mor family transcriptional regulator
MLDKNSIDKVKRLYITLHNESEVAKELGISRQALYEYRNRHGINYDPKSAKKKTYKDRYGIRNDKILKLYDNGTTINELAKLFNMKKPTINYILSKENVKRDYVHPSAKRNMEIFRLRKSGVPVRNLAKKYNLSRYYVSTMIYKLKNRLSKAG